MAMAGKENDTSYKQKIAIEHLILEWINIFHKHDQFILLRSFVGFQSWQYFKKLLGINILAFIIF